MTRDIAIARNEADRYHEEYLYSLTASFSREYQSKKLAAKTKKVINRNLANAESQWNAVAKRQQPEQWVLAIEKINSLPIRVQVACTVWRDWFSNRIVAQRWNSLDAYLAAWRPDTTIDAEQTVAALQLVGYPQRIATVRLKQMINAQAKHGPFNITPRDESIAEVAQ